MGVVWTFGDSLTERYNPIFEWSRDYIEWKGYLPKVYGNFVSETLGYDLQNMGKAGSDNYTIFETFCNTYPLMGDDDIIIIGWSCYLRFRLADKWSKWGTVIANFDNFLGIFNVSETTINEILINRDNVRYIDEVNNWIKFINVVCSNKKVIHWTPFESNKRYGVGFNSFYFPTMERIDTETEGLIDDAHFSERGHQTLASKMIHIMENNETPETIIKLI